MLPLLGLISFSGFSLAATVPYHESRAYICRACTDPGLARQIAARHAASVQCVENGMNENGRPNQSCGGPSRRVLLLNPVSNQVFAYVVRYEFTAQGQMDTTPIVHYTTLSAQEAEGYQALVEFYSDYIKSIGDLSAQSAGNSAAIAAASVLRTASAADGCPTETALNYYFDSGRMDQLRQSVEFNAASRQHPLHKHIDKSAVASEYNVGVTLGAASYSAQYAQGETPVRYIHEFSQSEVPNTVRNDRLVFDVSFSGFDSKNFPVLGLTLRLKESKIADVNGADVLNMKTDNPCIIAALNKLAASGDINLRSGGKSIDTAGTPSGSGKSAPGSTFGWCTISIYQWGQLQGTFIVPKERNDCH